MWNSLLEDKKYFLSLGMPREPLSLIGGSAKGRGGGEGKKRDYYSIRGICLLSYTSDREADNVRVSDKRLLFYQRDLPTILHQ